MWPRDRVRDLLAMCSAVEKKVMNAAL